PASQAFQSPIETPTRPPKPTPVTPPPTIPPKPSPPTVTVTLPPYPILQTPTPPGTPTAVPTPRATVTPTPVVTVVPGPLPLGLKIVCVDKGEDEWTSVIWMANVDDLNHVQIITALRNLAPEFWPLAHVSPDGRHIAYILPRKHDSESALGIVNINGTENRILDDPVLGPGVELRLRWSPDSQWIAYLRRMPPRGERAETEIWVVRPDGTEKRMVASESGEVFLIGWARDGSQIYYTPGGRDLWAVNVSGEAPPSVLLHFDEPAAPLRLSPDGEKITYEIRESHGPGPVTLGVASIDGQEKHILAESIDSRNFDLWSYSLSPIWSPDSSRVAYSIPINRMHIEILSSQWDAPTTRAVIRSREKAYYYLLSWSPESKYIVAWRHLGDAIPGLGLHPVLISLRGEGKVERVHCITPGFYYCPFAGWLEDTSRIERGGQ
ncbi:MAG: TolB family protein, partial [Anaerolineae bacterium]